MEVQVAQIKLTNKMKQSLPIYLMNAQGKAQSWTLPPMGTRIIDESEMSQDVLDKQNRHYIVVEQLG